jgi:hypothetical protein
MVARSDAITLISQYFVHQTPHRAAEVQYCLRRNLDNECIDEIHLLNERAYSRQELGVDIERYGRRVRLVDEPERLTYRTVFDYVERAGLAGYVIIANADIFFDKTVREVRETQLRTTKSMLAQLRFDVAIRPFGLPPKRRIFGPRSDSQDAWIFHTDWNVPASAREQFDFQLGYPGCDNLFAQRAHDAGYALRNAPYQVRCLHYHTRDGRSWKEQEPLPGRYRYIVPELRWWQSCPRTPMIAGHE